MILCGWMTEQRQRGTVKGQRLLKATKEEIVESYDCPHSEQREHMKIL